MKSVFGWLFVIGLCAYGVFLVYGLTVGFVSAILEWWGDRWRRQIQHEEWLEIQKKKALDFSNRRS